MNPNTPGTPASSQNAVGFDTLSASARFGVSGRITLCETVTTGKCFTGFTCGSSRR